ncbi:MULTISPECIES: hypothetical protein [unclassified Endozoicomonas]|uniref:hypothetical protein n=1 Tax=unclassified Endozoicomonas TaxID=2644528 RepID=UPI003BAEF569
MKKQVIKKYCNLKVLWSFITVLAILLMPTTSLAGYYLLHLKGTKSYVRLLLSVEPDTETDGSSQVQGPQEPSSGLLSRANRESGTIDDLPPRESGRTDSASVPQEECGAVGGLPAYPAIGTAALPVITTLIDYINDWTRSLTTGSTTVLAWLTSFNTATDIETATEIEHLPAHEIPESELRNYVMTLINLMEEPILIYANQPSVSSGSCTCDSLTNLSGWRRKFAIFLRTLSTAARTAGNLGTGVPGMEFGWLVAESLSTFGSISFFSHSQFPNHFQVSFTFSRNGLTITQEIDALQQIAQLLKCSGGYNLRAFERQVERQILTFNVQVSDCVDADQLRRLLETSNQQLANPFSIKVSPNGS